MFPKAAVLFTDKAPPKVPLELTLMNPVTVVFPKAAVLFTDKAPPKVPLELTLMNPVTVVFPKAAVLFTDKAPLTVASLTTFIVLENWVLPVTVKVLPVIDVFVTVVFPSIENAVTEEFDFSEILLAVIVVLPFTVTTAFAFNVVATTSTLLVTLRVVPLIVALVALTDTFAELIRVLDVM